MDKNELVNKIRGIEGLTNDEKSALIEMLRKQKKYGLVWEDKPEDVEERLREELPMLIEDTDKAIISTDTDAPNHILIEGDNLEALTALAYTHEGNIDVIYIDPPYNTGNKDFVYNDKFVDSEDTYRHSKWLSFMNKRLRIAKQLLSNKGVIFISIDDNEQAQLKMLCDEIFSPSNFVGTYFWKRTSTPPALSYKIRRKLEYVLCYQKTDIPQRTYAQGYVDGGDAPLLNSGNPMGILQFPVGSVYFNIPDGVYSAKSTYKIELLENVIVEHGKNINAFSARGHFKWGQNNLEKEVSEGTYFLIKSLQFSPRFQKSTKATKVPSNIVDDEVGVGTNEDAQKEVEALNVDFNYAKPISLVSYLSKMPFWNEKDITILDFFAGSGTTLHATMQLNAEDGGHRKCILVTNNENNICENVTYVRNKRVIQGYTTPKGEDVPGLTSNTLRYYRTDFVPREKTQKNMRALVAAATDMLCIKNDIYTETHEIGGAKMRPSLARHFKTGNNEMLIIYDDRAIPYIVDKLKDIDVKEPIMVYVFSPNDYPYTDEFFEVADKVKLCALPAAIYETYSKVLKRPKPHFLDEEKEKMVEAEKEDELDELFTTIDEEGGEA